MSSLSQIRATVQAIVNDRHRDIIFAVYKFMMRKHKPSCGCDYCKLHHKYLIAYIQYRRHRKWIDSDEYPYYDSHTLSDDLKLLARYKADADVLKAQCDQLKQLDGGVIPPVFTYEDLGDF